LAVETTFFHRWEIMEQSPDILPCIFCFSSRHLIRDAIFSNDFLKNLEKFQVREIVSCMYPKEYDKDNYIIKEGEIGHALFVISGTMHRTLCMLSQNRDSISN
jgi:hypothetical protein